jgi:pimeloyl-ACP methyl ester carboxylesterase
VVVCAVVAISAQPLRAADTTFDSAGVPIRYLDTGREAGELVVLIHGFAVSIETQWAPVIAALKDEYRVIALDCRGHGRSGKPHDPAKYGLEMVADVARLLDHLQIERAQIVGYSMGAVIALDFAVHYPQRAQSIVLGGSGGADRSQERLVLDLADSLEKGEGLGPLVTALTPDGRPKPPEATIKLINAAVLSVNDPLALAAAARGAAGDHGLFASDAEIETVRAPVLAIMGSDDPLHGSIERLKRLLPAAKVVLIKKADHMTAWTRPEFMTELRAFLEANRQHAER